MTPLMAPMVALSLTSGHPLCGATCMVCGRRFLPNDAVALVRTAGDDAPRVRPGLVATTRPVHVACALGKEPPGRAALIRALKGRKALLETRMVALVAELCRAYARDFDARTGEVVVLADAILAVTTALAERGAA